MTDFEQVLDRVLELLRAAAPEPLTWKQLVDGCKDEDHMRVWLAIGWLSKDRIECVGGYTRGVPVDELQFVLIAAGS